MPCVLSVFGGIVPQRIGGIEMFARELSQQVASAGWNSVLCFMAEPPDAVRRFLDMPGVTLEVAPESARQSWAGAQRLGGLLKRYRPEILHLYFTDPVSIYPWVGRRHGVRHIYLTDQISRPEGYVPVRAAQWKRAVRQALTWPLERLIAISDYNARCDSLLGLVADKRIARIYNAVDLSKPVGDGAAFRRKYAIPESRRIVLQVSWMIPEKGIPDLLDAAALVLKADGDVQFVLAGEGVHRKEYMEYAAALGIADHLTWTGLLGDPLTEGVYSAADVVCQLSRWHEAFGWVIAEGMTCGKPVVATNVGAIPEVVKDGVSGFLVPPRDPAAVAARILDLLRDEPLRRRMGEAGRTRVQELFNLQHTVADLVALYGLT